jgi:hypothetical protein
VSKPRYILRFFFDAGSGVCLWSGNKAAEERFDYPVETARLNLPPDLAADLEQLITDYDADFPWDDPGTRDPARLEYLRANEEGLYARVDALLPRLREALGPEFEILDQRRR